MRQIREWRIPRNYNEVQKVFIALEPYPDDTLNPDITLSHNELVVPIQSLPTISWISLEMRSGVCMRERKIAWVWCFYRWTVLSSVTVKLLVDGYKNIAGFTFQKVGQASSSATLRPSFLILLDPHRSEYDLLPLVCDPVPVYMSIGYNKNGLHICDLQRPRSRVLWWRAALWMRELAILNFRFTSRCLWLFRRHRSSPYRPGTRIGGGIPRAYDNWPPRNTSPI